MPDLFTPLELPGRGVTLRNRIGVSPMCQYSADDGVVNDWHVVHLGARATGGAGLIIAEKTAVEARGRITPGCAGIWDDAHVAPWRRVTNFLRAHGAVAGIQLGHAGRKAGCSRPWEGATQLEPGEGGWETVAPSAIAFGGRAPRVPTALDLDGVHAVREAFVAAARRSVDAGFQLVELHAAHGYLLHQFLSPHSNRRDDAYGGDFDGRTRLLRETAEAVRSVLPDDLLLAVRFSCTDWTDEGWTLDETVRCSAILKDLGVDLIDCSSGGSVVGAGPGFFDAGPGFQVPFADRIRREAGVATACVGGITAPEHADAIVREGRADVVLLGREMLRDPMWAWHAAERLGRAEAAAEGGTLPDQLRYWIGPKGG